MKDRFLEYITYEKRYSPHTVTAYRIDLDQFFEFLIIHYQVTDIREVDSPVIRSWLVSLMESGHSSRSVNRKLTTLKSFYRFLLKENYVELNPLRKIVAPRSVNKLPEFVESAKMQALLEQLGSAEGYPGFRDRIIIELFYNTGMRLSELVNLQDRDIDFSNGNIKVLGKRNKERLIPFSNKIKDLLQFYLKERSGFINKMLISAQNF